MSLMKQTYDNGKVTRQSRASQGTSIRQNRERNLNVEGLVLDLLDSSSYSNTKVNFDRTASDA